MNDNTKILNLVEYKSRIELLTIYHDCHRCNTPKAIPQRIDTEKDLLEKDCRKCHEPVCIW
jgi:DNA polymerase III alpha subunit (gram-positive type)